MQAKWGVKVSGLSGHIVDGFPGALGHFTQIETRKYHTTASCRISRVSSLFLPQEV